jgi:hypothetical protein
MWRRPPRPSGRGKARAAPHQLSWVPRVSRINRHVHHSNFIFHLRTMMPALRAWAAIQCRTLVEGLIG